MAQNAAAQAAANTEKDQPQEINSMMNNLGAMMAQFMASDFAAEKSVILDTCYIITDRQAFDFAKGKRLLS